MVEQETEIAQEIGEPEFGLCGSWSEADLVLSKQEGNLRFYFLPWKGGYGMASFPVWT